MNSKEALEILIKQANERKLSNKIVANGIAVSLLEKLVERDTPMLPIKLKWKNTENYYYVCPKCEELVARTDEVFCQDCGQRLDWEMKE